jgi:hypothetical protein
MWKKQPKLRAVTRHNDNPERTGVMKYCASEGCSGLDPCDGCTKIRRAVLMTAVSKAGLSKEQAEKFFHAYAESFDAALSEVRHLAEEAGRKRLAEKEARDKEVRTIDKVSRYKGGREEKQAGTVSKVTPLKEKLSTKERLAVSSSYGKNGQGSVVENSHKSEQPTEAVPTSKD